MKTAVLFLSFVCLCAANSARTEDIITLKDGSTVSGQVTKQDEDTVFIQQKDGEARGIAKSRIEKIERLTIKKVEQRPQQAQPGPRTVLPDVVERTSPVSAAFLSEIKELGAPDPDRRKAALENAKKKKAEAVPVILAMMNPKQESDEYVRLSLVRALVDLSPLTDQASQVLAWSAVMDPSFEVRREACRTIRHLQDDRTIRDVIRFAFSEDPKMRSLGAAALHEIDDNRVFATLVRAVPSPSVTANYGEPGQVTTPKYNLPVGPYGANMPIFLPQGPVTGVANDIGSPSTELLKQIAGKDLGNLPSAWFNWYREKIGDITAAERDAYRENRSARDRMGAP